MALPCRILRCAGQTIKWSRPVWYGIRCPSLASKPTSPDNDFHHCPNVSRREMSQEQAKPPAGRVARALSHPLVRGLLLLAVTAAAVWAIAPQALDLPALASHIRAANPLWVAAAVLAQVVRYAGAGLLMTLSARAAGSSAPGLLSTEAALASGAAARIIPFGGAGGIAVRAAYLKRRGMPEAAIAGYFVLQNLLGTAWLLATLLLAFALGAAAGSDMSSGSIVPLLVVSVVAAVAVVYPVLRPVQSRGLAAALGRRLDELLRSRGRRSTLEESLPGFLMQAVAALRIGSVVRNGLVLAAVFSSWTLLGDTASLHFCAWALDVRTTLSQRYLAYYRGSLARLCVGMAYGMA